MLNRGVDRSRALLAADEIRVVVELFQVPPVIRAHAYNRGSARFPKAIIQTTDGARFLLKRRAGTPENIARVTLSHEVQIELGRNHFPLPELKRTKADATWIFNDGCIYEMFAFVDGDRFRRSAWEARESGLLLSRIHQTLQEWKPSAPTPAHVGYHKSQSVGSSWALLASRILTEDPSASRKRVERLGEELRSQYEMAAAAADTVLNDSAARVGPVHRSILHGDFHPGNILFGPETPIALLDFDATRLDRTLFDIANGALQFSIPSMGRKLVPHWDATLNIPLIESFLNGYAWTDQFLLDATECSALPALMIEATIAETIPRIALGGVWEGRPGIEVLQFVARRAEWIWSERSSLTNLCQSCMRQ